MIFWKYERFTLVFKSSQCSSTPQFLKFWPSLEPCQGLIFLGCRLWTGYGPSGKDFFQFWSWSLSLDWSQPILTRNTPGSLSKRPCRKKTTFRAPNAFYFSLLSLEWRTGASALGWSLLVSVQPKTVLSQMRETPKTLMQFYFMQGTWESRSTLRQNIIKIS